MRQPAPKISRTWQVVLWVVLAASVVGFAVLAALPGAAVASASEANYSAPAGVGALAREADPSPTSTCTAANLFSCALDVPALPSVAPGGSNTAQTPSFMTSPNASTPAGGTTTSDPTSSTAPTSTSGNTSTSNSSTTPSTSGKTAPVVSGSTEGLDYLPAWRWRSASVNLYSNSGYNPSDIAAGSGIQVLTFILFTIASTIWWLLLGLLKYVMSNPIGDLADGFITQTFHDIGNTLWSSGIILLACLFVLFLGMRFVLKGKSAKAISITIAFLFSVAAIQVGLVATQSGNAADAIGSPVWLSNTGTALTDDLAGALATGLGTVPALGNSAAAGQTDSPNCSTYINYLVMLYTEAEQAKPGYQNNGPANSDPGTIISMLWMRSYYDYWAEAQFGSSTAGEAAGCHVLEGASDSIYRTQAQSIANGAYSVPGVLMGGDKITMGINDKTAAPNPRSGNIDGEKQIFGWMACKWENGAWTTRDGWQFTGATPESCASWYQTGASPVTIVDPGEAQKDQVTSGVGMVTGGVVGFVKGIIDFAQGPETLQKSISAATEGKSGTEIQQIYAVGDQIQALWGQNAGQRVFMAIMAVIAAIAYAFALGGIALGLLVAQFGFVIMLMLLPVTLLMMGIGAANEKGKAHEIGWKMAKVTFGFFLSKLMLNLVFIVLIEMVYIIQSLTSHAGGFMGSLLRGVAPILALFLMRYILKAAGLGSITSPSGALSFASSAGLKAGGGDIKIGGKTISDRLGNNRGFKALDRGRDALLKKGSEKVLNSKKMGDVLGSKDPETGQREGGMLGTLKNIPGALKYDPTSPTSGLTNKDTLWGRTIDKGISKAAAVARAGQSRRRDNQVLKLAQKGEYLDEKGRALTPAEALRHDRMARGKAIGESLTDRMASLTGLNPDGTPKPGGVLAATEAAKELYGKDAISNGFIQCPAIPPGNQDYVQLGQGLTDEQCYNIMSHPFTSLPAVVRQRQNGESDEDYIGRLTGACEQSGLFDKDTGRFADMLALNGLSRDSKEVRSMLAEFRGGTNNELAEALAITLSAGDIRVSSDMGRSIADAIRKIQMPAIDDLAQRVNVGVEFDVNTTIRNAAANAAKAEKAIRDANSEMLKDLDNIQITNSVNLEIVQEIESLQMTVAGLDEQIAQAGRDFEKAVLSADGSATAITELKNGLQAQREKAVAELSASMSKMPALPENSISAISSWSTEVHSMNEAQIESRVEGLMASVASTYAEKKKVLAQQLQAHSDDQAWVGFISQQLDKAHSEYEIDVAQVNQERANMSAQAGMCLASIDSATMNVASSPDAVKNAAKAFQAFASGIAAQAKQDGKARKDQDAAAVREMKARMADFAEAQKRGGTGPKAIPKSTDFFGK